MGGADEKLDRSSVRIGVRMYDDETVELALLALEGGMTQSEAAALAGVSARTVASWAAGRRPHRRRGPDANMCRRCSRRGERRMSSPKGIYDPPRSGPLAGLDPAQIENLLLRAVLADLKAGGWVPGSISNRSKCELGERLRRATGLPLRSITGFLRISKSSYEYHRARLGIDRDAELRAAVTALFEEGGRTWGYRTIWARLRRAGTVVSEKVVRRVMREEGLEVVYNRRRRRGWSSYAGEVSRAPGNLVRRRFSAPAPDELWLTDITEFRLPSGARVYLSAMIDCFDGRPVAWRIGGRPSAGLANATLREAIARRRRAGPTIVHSDRGGHYRWPEWIALCEENGIVRSMSRKACSPDNAAMEGFFGRLKNEFFHHRDWRGVGPGEFSERLDGYLRYYCEGRIKRSLGWLSPDEYRRKLGYAV